MNNLSVQVRRGVWSGLSAGNDGCRAGVVLLSSSKTCPLESGHGRLERPVHASQPMSVPSIDARCGDCSALHFYVALDRNNDSVMDVGVGLDTVSGS